MPVSWIQYSLKNFPLFVLNRDLAKANCTGNRVCTSCGIVVLDSYTIIFPPQAQEPPGDGPHLRSGDGHRILLRRRDGLRVPDSAQDWRGAPPHDPHLVPEPRHRVLPHPGARVHERQLQHEHGAAQTLHPTAVCRAADR